MDNILQMLRLNSIFGGNAPLSNPNDKYRTPTFVPDSLYGGQQSDIGTAGRMRDVFQAPPIGQPTSVADNTDDISSLIQQLYKPDTTYTDMYNKELSGMPVRNNPGIGRKIAASVLGAFGGPKTAENVMYGGYDRKLADWKDRMDAIQPGLVAERAGNANLRQLATATATDQLRQRDIERKERTDTARTEREKADSETRRMRAEAYVKNLEFKQMNPDYDLVGVKGGNYHWVNPKDPREAPIDTGIKTGTMDRMEELNLQQKNRIAAINAQGAQTRATEGVRHVNDLSEIHARGEETRTTKSTPTTPEGQVQETTQETTVTDAEGKPVGTRKTTTSRSTRPGNVKPGYTRMVSPDGKTERDVPNDQVAFYKSKGAKVKGR